jgi:RNA polymerase sigma factor (sigma-70 family)
MTRKAPGDRSGCDFSRPVALEQVVAVTIGGCRPCIDVIAMQEPRPRSSSPPPDRVAFEALYRAAGTAVLGYALRRAASREDALDVVAETFLVAWRRRMDIPADPEEVRPWLFGIARRCLADVERSAERAGRLGARLADALDATVVPDPALRVAADGDHRLVREAMGQLSAADRELISLIAWEALTPTQAATALGLTPAATRVRLHRARTRLKSALSTTTHPEEADHDQ